MWCKYNEEWSNAPTNPDHILSVSRHTHTNSESTLGLGTSVTTWLILISKIMLSRAPQPFDQIFDMQSAGPNIKKVLQKSTLEIKNWQNF